MKRYDCLTQAPFDMREAPDGDWVSFDDAEDAIRAAVAAERERCAKIVESFPYRVDTNGDWGARWELCPQEHAVLAAAIRGA